VVWAFPWTSYGLAADVLSGLIGFLADDSRPLGQGPTGSPPGRQVAICRNFQGVGDGAARIAWVGEGHAEGPGEGARVVGVELEVASPKNGFAGASGQWCWLRSKDGLGRKRDVWGGPGASFRAPPTVFLRF